MDETRTGSRKEEWRCPKNDKEKEKDQRNLVRNDYEWPKICNLIKEIALTTLNGMKSFTRPIWLGYKALVMMKICKGNKGYINMHVLVPLRCVPAQLVRWLPLNLEPSLSHSTPLFLTWHHRIIHCCHINLIFLHVLSSSSKSDFQTRNACVISTCTFSITL